MKKLLLVAFFILLAPCIWAQWNADPALNTFVAGSSLLRTYSQVVSDPGGSFYISSWESVSDIDINFEFWLQRLDNDGYRQWGEEGIMISNNPSRTWLSGYDLAVDATGNVIMAIEDMRSGDGYSHVALYCYNAAGQPVWDADGIQADTGSYASYSPVLAVTPAGNVIVAWSCIYDEGQDEEYAVRVKKYSPDGTALWTGAREFTGPDSTFIYPDIVTVGEDDFLMVWQRKFRVGAGAGEQWFSYIMAQRFDPDGFPSWTSDVMVCDHADTAYLMPQYLEVALSKDENDGIFLGWFDGRYDPVTSNVFVQYLSADGTFRWPQNGIAVSPVNIGHHRTYPLIACDTEGEDVYLFWNERQNTSFGLCGQKITPDGSLAWGDLGKKFRGFSPDTLFFLSAVDFTSSGDLLVVDYLEVMQAVGLDTITTDQACAYRIDPSGELVWSPGILELSTSEGIKSLPVMSEPLDEMYVISWVENRDMPMLGFGSVYAQNFNMEGNMGPLFILEATYPGNEMVIYPNPARDFLFIGLKQQVSPLPVEFIIYDSRGRPVVSGQSDRPSIRIDLSGLTQGVYLVRVKGDGLSESRTLLVIP